QTPQDEQEGERDDERRQFRAVDDVAVQETDEQRGGNRQQQPRPEWPAVDRHGNDERHSGRSDHRPNRQVEFATDHEQRRGDCQDAELGGYFEPAGNAAGGQETPVARDETEEREDEYRPGHCTEFRPAEQPPQRAYAPEAFIL